MTAIAPSTHARDEDGARFAAPVTRPGTCGQDRSTGLAAEPVPSPAAARTPWREPLFYLSFVAAALLFCAVGVILLYRTVTRRRWF